MQKDDKKWKVYVTGKLPEPALEKLSRYCDVDVHTNSSVMDPAVLFDKIKDKDALLSLLTDRIDEKIIEQGKRLKIIANYAVGYNNIDLEAAERKGIYVTNTPDVLTDSSADLAWALVFSVSRRIVEADRFTRQGMFSGWEPTLFLGQDVSGKTLGVIGCGRIGSNFASKAKAFGMKVLYHNRSRKIDFEQRTGAIYVDKETLLKESDVVSLHVPLTADTVHMISWDEFKLMKKTSILINTARGPVVDEKALVWALREKVIWGAGLDVFEHEPEIAPGLSELGNVVIVPHIASATIETRTKMGLMAVDNILAAMRGTIPPNVVTGKK